MAEATRGLSTAAWIGLVAFLLDGAGLRLAAANRAAGAVMHQRNNQFAWSTSIASLQPEKSRKHPLG